MAEQNHQALETTGQAHERAANVLAELISVASADKVYGEPVVAGDRTIITAAEVHTGMGFGYGLATGLTVPPGKRQREPADSGPRGGGGGGGQALGRPVAVVTIDPDGVTVQPVLDRTKIVLTALTALGAIGLTLIRMRRASRQLVLRGRRRID
jgi:uncharacterized spore protein YtfJ